MTATGSLLDVIEVERLSPNLFRAVLGGPGLRGFTTLGAPDEACVFSFPALDGPAEPDPAAGRWYTVRRFDAQRHRLTIDLVRHDGGVGAAWAASARAGDRLLVTHQNSWYKRPGAAQWQLLLGDITALPAIGRIVEETASTVRTTAVVEVPSPDDEQRLDGADVTWAHTPRLSRGSSLAQLARALEIPSGAGYVYVAGEAAATRAVRKYLRHELGMPTGSYGVIGYWRVDAERWTDKYRKSGVDAEALYQQAEAAGSDPEDARDIYEQKLDEAGLL